MIFKALIPRIKRAYDSLCGPTSDTQILFEYYDWLETKPRCLEYRKNGILHRLDGPAVQRWSDDGQSILEIWYKEGKLHNLNGPAYRRPAFWSHEIPVEYWINGKEYTKEEFDEYVRGLDSEQLAVMVELGQTFE